MRGQTGEGGARLGEGGAKFSPLLYWLQLDHPVLPSVQRVGDNPIAPVLLWDLPALQCLSYAVAMSCVGIVFPLPPLLYPRKFHSTFREQRKCFGWICA